VIAEQDLVYVDYEVPILPDGWRMTTLEDLVSEQGMFCDGDWVESKDQDPNGDVRLIQLADIGVGSYRDRSDRYLTSERASALSCSFLERGDILVARMPDPLGRACIFPGDKRRAVTVVDVAIVRPNNPDVSNRWLMHRINSMAFRNAVASLQSGSTRLRISRKNLARIAFPLPPLVEQLAAVEEIEKQLSRLDVAVANLQRVKANLKRYKASVLKAAVEGRLVETEASIARREGRSYETGEQLLQRILEVRRERPKGRSKYKEPALPNLHAVTELPDGWAWASVEQVVAHLTDGDHQAPPQTDSGVPFLVIGNVRTGEIDLSNTRFVGENYYNSLDPYRQLAKGDLLYTLVGSYGIPARVKTTERFCVQRHMAILRPHAESPMDYLTIAMASDNVFKQATEVSTGTAQMTVPLSGLRSIVFGLPPKTEQTRIVAEVESHLSIIREVEAEVDISLQRALAMRQAILSKQFSV